ncbi:MAG: cupin domain-containing protein [Frankia sp.]
MLPVEYRSGPSSFEDYFVHDGEEFIYLAHGRVQVDLEGAGVYDLAGGDTLYYDGGVRHRWRVLILSRRRAHARSRGPASPDSGLRPTGDGHRRR